jgi:hypothetical protein
MANELAANSLTGQLSYLGLNDLRSKDQWPIVLKNRRLLTRVSATMNDLARALTNVKDHLGRTDRETTYLIDTDVVLTRIMSGFRDPVNEHDVARNRGAVDFFFSRSNAKYAIPEGTFRELWWWVSQIMEAQSEYDIPASELSRADLLRRLIRAFDRHSVFSGEESLNDLETYFAQLHSRNVAAISSLAQIIRSKRCQGYVHCSDIPAAEHIKRALRAVPRQTNEIGRDLPDHHDSLNLSIAIASRRSAERHKEGATRFILLSKTAAVVDLPIKLASEDVQGGPTVERDVKALETYTGETVAEMKLTFPAIYPKSLAFMEAGGLLGGGALSRHALGKLIVAAQNLANYCIALSEEAPVNDKRHVETLTQLYYDRVRHAIDELMQCFGDYELEDAIGNHEALCISDSVNMEVISGFSGETLGLRQRLMASLQLLDEAFHPLNLRAGSYDEESGAEPFIGTCWDETNSPDCFTWKLKRYHKGKERAIILNADLGMAPGTTNDEQSLAWMSCYWNAGISLSAFVECILELATSPGSSDQWEHLEYVMAVHSHGSTIVWHRQTSSELPSFQHWFDMAQQAAGNPVDFEIWGLRYSFRRWKVIFDASGLRDAEEPQIGFVSTEVFESVVADLFRETGRSYVPRMLLVNALQQLRQGPPGIVRG